MTIQSVRLKTSARTQLKDITGEVAEVVKQSGVANGTCHVYVPHTTAGVTINEAADPDVATDIGAAFDKMVPRDAGYKHFEGNADSHIKAVLVGASETIPVESGTLSLGRWQGVFFCEFDGPRERTVQVSVRGEEK